MEEFFKSAERLASSLPGATPTSCNQSVRQPVHVVYGGADRFSADIATKFSEVAIGILNSVAADESEFRDIFNDGGDSSVIVPEGVFGAVKEKLEKRPIEDFRIDFEDGYGFRSDDEEDADCARVADELASGMARGILPATVGVRIKSFQRETYNRATRSLALCVGSLLEKTGGVLPPGFIVTLPKVRNAEEVRVLDQLLTTLELESGTAPNEIRIELMAETPESVLRIDELVNVIPERIEAVHFGAYDYTSELGVTASHQDPFHPTSVFAKAWIQLKLAGSGIRLSDSVTKKMPVPLHRGTNLSPLELSENRKSIQEALRAHYENVALSMMNGYFQSWDLHPGQLIARYAAVFSFFRNEMTQQGERLRSFLMKATQATLTGNLFDDAATAQGYLNFFRRAHACGALSGEEIQSVTGLEMETLLQMSFSRSSADRVAE